MSLLEDVFLGDEAGEAQELERVIEGDDYDERPLSPNSDDNGEKEDEAEEDKRRVDPTKPKSVRVVKNPRFVLNTARLTGPRGIQVIPEHFKNFKFKGKGYEKEDLDMVLKKLEHWAYRLYPKFEFKDCLKKIEMLGKKRTIMVNLIKIRSDQFMSEETVVQKDSSDEEEPPQEEDEFDKLLQQQIELARCTPAPGPVKKPRYTPTGGNTDFSLLLPKATSSPSISDEQRDRMLRNRKLAEERRLAKLKNDSLNENAEVVKPSHVEIEGITELSDEVLIRKQNRSNVIDSSDDEDGETAVNQSVTVDIHSKIDNNIIEIQDQAVYRKQSKANILNSFDDDEDLTVTKDYENVYSKVDENKDLFDKIKANDIHLDCNKESQMVLDGDTTKYENSTVTESNIDITNTDTLSSVEKTKDNDMKSQTNDTLHTNTNSVSKNCSISNIEDFDDKIEEEISINKHSVENESVNHEKDLRNDVVSVENKENVNQNIDDIIDVDFSDDF